MKLLERYTGAILGHAIGDALGTVHTMQSADQIPHELRFQSTLDTVTNTVLAPGHISDDTSQLICLGESLLESGFNIRDQFERYQRWMFHGYATPFGRAIGYGNRTNSLLRTERRLNRQRMKINDETLLGTGGLMRVLPIALYYRSSVREVINKSQRSTAVTHNNTEVMLYSAIFSVLVNLMLQGNSEEAALRKTQAIFATEPLAQSLLNQSFTSKPAHELKASFKARDTLEVALWAWYSTDSYEAAVKRAVGVGVNTDTFGAVTGGLAGSTYGDCDIPAIWKRDILMKTRLLGLARQLYRKSLQRTLRKK